MKNCREGFAVTEIIVLAGLSLYAMSIPVRLFIQICRHEREKQKRSDIWSWEYDRELH